MTERRALEGRRILVVEDEFMIAETLSDILEEAGATVVGPIGWADKALAFLQSADSALDGAVLDINLHGQDSYPIADALLDHEVRFVFVTGYDGRALEPAYRDHPRCEKPLQPQAIIAALSPAAE
ncbi:MAG TPA: response regulator [Lichenihabitans sp.]|jgi:DNA-binding LytR/AlgR family response regulator|nr:response regulator [Lichenihabitans sp.]